jgi:hypothetical protein
MIKTYLDAIAREVTGIMDELHLTEIERRQIVTKDSIETSEFTNEQNETVVRMIALFEKHSIDVEDREYVCEQLRNGLLESEVFK